MISCFKNPSHTHGLVWNFFFFSDVAFSKRKNRSIFRANTMMHYGEIWAET